MTTVAQETQAKETGMNIAAANHAPQLELARKIVTEQLAPQQQFITSDDVQRELKKQGVESTTLGNAAGSIFRGLPCVKPTGYFVKSQREGRHRNAISVYESRSYTGPQIPIYNFVRQYNDAK